MDDLRPLTERLMLLQDRLDAAYFRPRYKTVGRLAHGWTKRVSRGVGAILAGVDAGYSGELSPMGRSVVEHVVALKWLVAEGDRINSPLRTNYGLQISKLGEAWRSASAGSVDEAGLAAAIASSEHDDHGRDHFQQFAHRVVHGNEEDLLMYNATLMESHATYRSAAVYWSKKDPKPTATEEWVNWESFCPLYLYQGLRAYSGILLAPPWKEELAAARAALVAQDPSLDRILD
ncbi:hypothetical protein [Homoserinibacter gongjuensis]|nr:hypothetical protein [Homoserinibacter gongjuensis]